MPATVQIWGYHGAAASVAGADITSTDTRFKLADNDTADAENPVTVPTSGTNYSYIKNERLYCTVTPASVVDNLRFFTDGSSWGTGIAIYAKVSNSYVDPIVNGTAALTGVADETTYTSAAPLALTGSISNPDTGAFGQFVVRQGAVGTGAAPGVVSGKTQYFRYDEI